VCAHFSLHHTPDLARALKEIKDMKSSHLLIAEYDFIDPPTSARELVNHFKQTVSGQMELADFIHQAGGDVAQGHHNCWRFHLKYGFEHYVEAVQGVGGTIIIITLPQTRFSIEKRKFLIEVEL